MSENLSRIVAAFARKEEENSLVTGGTRRMAMVQRKNLWRLKPVAMAVLLVFVLCSCRAQPDVTELLSEGLDTYMVRVYLSLQEINETVQSINNFETVALSDLKILQAQMEQFRILAKPEIIISLDGLPGEVRNQIVSPQMWESAVSDIPEIYHAVDHVRYSVVQPLIKKLEKGEKPKEDDILKWKSTQTHFINILENLNEFQLDNHGNLEPDQSESIKKALHSASILQEMNL